MRSFILALFASLLLVTNISLTAAAEEAPDAMVRAVVAKIKETGNPAEIVNHVDWDEAFKTMPEPDKYQLKIQNPAEMKNFFREMLESPSAAMKKNMLDRVSALPADKQEEAKVAIEKLSERLQAKEAELKQRVKDTNYQVSPAKIKGDTATLTLTQIYKGEKKEEKLELKKKNGEWKLPSIKMGQDAVNAAKTKAAADAKSVSNPAPIKANKAKTEKPKTDTEAETPASAPGGM